MRMVIERIWVKRAVRQWQQVLGRGCGRGHAGSGVKKAPDSIASKVLVIDDEVDFRQVLIKCLSKQGYTVVGAADGKAGVGLAAETLHHRSRVLAEYALKKL